MLRSLIAALAATLALGVQVRAEDFETQLADALAAQQTLKASAGAQQRLAAEKVSQLRTSTQEFEARGGKMEIVIGEDGQVRLVVRRPPIPWPWPDDGRDGRGRGRRRWCEDRYDDCRYDCRAERGPWYRRCIDRCDWDYDRCLDRR